MCIYNVCICVYIMCVYIVCIMCVHVSVYCVYNVYMCVYNVCICVYIVCIMCVCVCLCVYILCIYCVYNVCVCVYVYHAFLGLDERPVDSVHLVVQSAGVAEVVSRPVPTPQRRGDRPAVHTLAALARDVLHQFYRRGTRSQP